MRHMESLSILQYNVRKSRDIVMASLLRDPRVMEFDILAIQEPWANSFMHTTHHPAKDRFHLCYPQNEGGSPPRVCLYINKRLDHSKWQFESYCRDLCTVTMTLGHGDEMREVKVHNIYNPDQRAENRRSVLPQLRRVLDSARQTEQILIGDFNLHHELWGGSHVPRTEAEAEDLVEIMEDYNLTNTLAPGTITYEEGGRQTTIDLCLVTLGLVDRVIRCEVDRSLDHDSDHLPIVTSLDMSPKLLSRGPSRDWKSIDEKRFRSAVLGKLPPQRRPRTRSALDRYVGEIVAALKSAIETAVPLRTWSPKSRRGWDEECTRVLAETKRLRRLHNLYHTEETWETYRAARNHKGRVIKKALRRAHRENVERASESPEALWRRAKWARNRTIQAPEVTPTLEHPDTSEMVSDPAEKAEIFRKAFFPSPPEGENGDIEDATYPDGITMPPITEQEVERAIQEASPLKAPGPDGIPNKALQLVVTGIKPHLSAIFNQSLNIGYCPRHFRESTTVVLRKQGKDNYTIPGSYRPIGLLNTMGKIMDSIIAQRLSYIAETHDLFPSTHMGGRKMRSTEHAVHHIIDKIYEAWNRGRGQVASLLLLDVSGAFDNVSHRRLLHNLRKRRVDEKVVRWISSLLEDRYTKILIDGFKTELHKICTGTVQGSPLSPILYIFYNADLIENCNLADDTTATGFIDDVAILTWGDTTTETCNKLQGVLQAAEQWAKTHASVFSPSKFQLTHFSRARTRIDTRQSLQTAWGEIPAKPTCKYLGLIMDSALHWKPHVDEVRRKATKTISALSSLGSSTWGLTLQDMRKIYQGVVVPQIMYACSAWSNSNWRTRNMPYTNKTQAQLRSLQARAARMISGAYKATSAAALDVETHLLPIEHQIWKHNADCLGRIGIGGLELQHSADGLGGQRTKMSPRRAIQKAILDEGGFDLKKMEATTPHIVPPWWTGPKTFIEESVEKAQARHQHGISNVPNAIHIYTDGSGINGHIGAAAVCTTTNQTKSAYMGDDTVSTVYAGELQGISLALQIAQEDRNRGNIRKKVLIYTDNQAAIRSLARPTGKSGTYLLQDITRRMQELRAQGLALEIRWIPAHKGIHGNEAADRAAKEATGWRQRGPPGSRALQPPVLHSLKSTLKLWSRRVVNDRWRTQWQQETRGRATFRHTPEPTPKVLQPHKNFSKRQSAIYIQLRTEKIGMNDFLFKRRVPGVTDPRCDCGEGRQTVAHILLQCRKHTTLRNQELGQFPGRQNLRKLLSERKVAAKVVKFMEQTQILGQFRISP